MPDAGLSSRRPTPRRRASCAVRTDDDVVLAVRGGLQEVGHRVLDLTQGLCRPEPPLLAIDVDVGEVKSCRLRRWRGHRAYAVPRQAGSLSRTIDWRSGEPRLSGCCRVPSVDDIGCPESCVFRAAAGVLNCRQLAHCTLYRETQPKCSIRNRLALSQRLRYVVINKIYLYEESVQSPGT
jgi:hypothetical protein